MKKKLLIKSLYYMTFNIMVFLFLFVSIEFILHLFFPDKNPFIKSVIEAKILNKDYVYTYDKNLNISQSWGYNSYSFITNSLGFRDNSTRLIEKSSNKRRVLFIGDSFTDGVGVDYDRTFVGLFAKNNPDLDILNASVTSYSPSIYNRKIKSYINQGYKFDEVIIYVDSSDIQDEAIIYHLDGANNLFKTDATECTKIGSPNYPEIFFTTPWYQKGLLGKSYILQTIRNFSLAMDLKKYSESLSLESLQGSKMAYSREFGRVAWSYIDKPDCFYKSSVDFGINRARSEMDDLYQYLKQRNVALSVAVYPWPHHLMYDNVQSRQVKIWEEWCKDKCKKFYNHYPDFFDQISLNKNSLSKFYIWGDVHFNQGGHEVIFSKLNREYQ